MAINVELLEKVKAYWREEPARGNMADWITTVVYAQVYLGHTSHAPACGTVACIAGTAVLLNAMERKPGLTPATIEAQYRGHYLDPDAAELIDPDGEAETQSLFYVKLWPDDLQRWINVQTPGTPEYTNVVCKAIDRWIEGGGRFQR